MRRARRDGERPARGVHGGAGPSRPRLGDCASGGGGAGGGPRRDDRAGDCAGGERPRRGAAGGRAWRAELRRLLPATRFDEPMRRHTTFRIGGPADAYLEIAELAGLRDAYAFARRRGLPVFLLGKGSNLLVRDGGIRGLVLRLRGEFEALEFEPFRESAPPEVAGDARGPRVRAGAGVRLPTLVVACAERGLGGGESLVGVPGTVGGALVMNAGTREGEMGDWTRGVRFFDPERLEAAWWGRERLHFEYRRSNLEALVILGAELELKRGGKVDILKRVREFQEKRRRTQPIHTYNVGSTFKNPPGRFVARLLEQAGLKGARSGGARISEKHANFFENESGATARDVLALVELARSAVRDRFGVELELEMKVVGEA